ncbi:uncharacterized protein LOC128712758 [Anopheles marshallii]|uniref:uncharacterized protein LOC128712758 n=1 Tax=Anopheles marshallii TaxID=1521116 RepID=UPI00237BD187|nr:uncharacterized protein LOC128712758 [Anopheles marshallii]
MNKRNIWKYDETKEMLQIMQDNNYAGSFSSKHKQNMEIFRRIENKMIESGYHYKNYLQIGVRWKNLKNLYMKAKRSKSKNQQQLFPYFEEMDCMLNHLPLKTSSEEYLFTSEPDETIAAAEHSIEQLSNANDDTAPKPQVTEVSTVNLKRKHTDIPKKMASTKVGKRYGPAQLPKSDRNSKLNATIAMSKQELSDEFYRSQKRLIDYEFNLYVRKEEEFIDRIHETTRTMLEESMDTFFTRLKDVLANQSVQHVEVIETLE